MKKILLVILLLSLCLKVNAQNDTTENKQIIADFTGKINKDELNFIKKNYDWNSEKILIINYTQPRSECHFDNHRHFKNGGKWFKKFYSKINLENCKNIFACSKHKKATLYYDNSGYFLTNYFSRKESCFAVLVINEQGDYLQFNGHYSEENVSSYIEYLKSLL